MAGDGRGGRRARSGRKPTPTHLKVVAGNPGKRALPKDEPKPGGELAESPPDHLGDGDYGCDLWAQLRPLLVRMGVGTEADNLALELLADTYNDYRKATDLIIEEGRTYETYNQNGGRMVRSHPAVAQAKEAKRLLLTLMAEFGLTPSSRSRIVAPGQLDDDPLLDYLRSGQTSGGA